MLEVYVLSCGAPGCERTFAVCRSCYRRWISHTAGNGSRLDRHRRLQPQDRARLPDRGKLPVLLELRQRRLGRQVPRHLVHQGHVVHQGHALPNRADEEDRSSSATTPPPDPQLVQGTGGHLHGTPWEPWRAQTIKSKGPPEDPTASEPSKPHRSPCFRRLATSPSQSKPTDSAEEAQRLLGTIWALTKTDTT